jgi:CheY-like chemotaxis protein
VIGMTGTGGERGLVLVVEDEPQIAEVQRRYLVNEGYGVHVERDGDSAITRGQRVARHTVEVSTGGVWTAVAQGTTIGYKRLHRIPATPAQRVRVTVTEAFGEPEGLQVQAWVSS